MGYEFDRLFCSWKVEDTSAKRAENIVVEVSDCPDFSNIITKVEGADLNPVETEIKPDLRPRTTYYWRVAVTGDSGETAVSDTALFETGKMDEPWQAEWIGTREEDTFHPVFVKEFSSGKRVKRARIYVCGLGLYEAYLNGVKIGDEYLAPFINDYLESYQYETYDITGMIAASNRLEIMLGRGWYMGTFGLESKDNNFGDRMKVIAELHVEYEDGSGEVIGSGESWQYCGSDIEDSGIYLGEIYNRRLWEGKDNSLKNAVSVSAPGKLSARFSVPVVVKEELAVQEILHTPAGETVLDFGQNHAGFMQFEADFAAGTTVTFECAEILQEGNFYHDNYREAESKFVYVSDGRKETVRPHFTFFGYRYLRVTGWPGEIKKEDVTAKVVYSDLERTGYIETSDEKINRLYANCIWGQKSNFIDMPTDCPQRSERLGWTGDAQVFAPTASYNMDTRAFYSKFLRDLRSEQVRANGAVANYIPSLGSGGASSVWGDVGTFVPAEMHKTFGETEALRMHYPLMRDWCEYMYRVDEEKGGKRLFLNGFQFGDWLALDGITEQSFKGSTDDDYIGTVYYYQSTKITGEMAERLGYSEDADKYKKRAEEIRQAIFAEYFTPSGRLAMDTQASYIVALRFGLYLDKQRLIDQFRERLKKDCYKIKCGFVGAPLLCVTLCENGMTDLAYHFLFQEGFPGWLYCVNLGATTIWERWNSLLADGTCSGTGMNSFNHYSYGSVVEFFYAYIAGIRPAEPGYRRAVIAPEPSMKFRFFNCSYNSASGKYVSNWKIAEDGTFSMHVEIPFGCEAVVTLPRCSGKNVQGIDAAVGADGSAVLSAGVYDFSYTPTRDFRRIYSPATRLGELAGDAEAMAILKEDLPNAYGMILGQDVENMNLSLGELSHMFFMGFAPEAVERATEKICALIRW